MKIILTILVILICSCYNKKNSTNNFLNNWVEEISLTHKRVLNFEKITDTTYFFQIAIFTKNLTLDSSEAAMENYLCGVINTKQNNFIISADYNLSNNFYIRMQESNLIFSFDKDYSTNSFFPNPENKFKGNYPIKYVFSKLPDTTISQKFEKLSENFYYENRSKATYGFLNKHYKNKTIRLYKKPFSIVNKLVNLNSNSLLRYCLINANFTKGYDNIFYDSTTYFNIFVLNHFNDTINAEYKSSINGWVKKSEINEIIEFNRDK